MTIKVAGNQGLFLGGGAWWRWQDELIIGRREGQIIFHRGSPLWTQTPENRTSDGEFVTRARISWILSQVPRSISVRKLNSFALMFDDRTQQRCRHWPPPGEECTQPPRGGATRASALLTSGGANPHHLWSKKVTTVTRECSISVFVRLSVMLILT